MNIKLRAKRVEKGFNQTELSKKLGMNISTYSKKELGKVNFTLTEIQDLMYYLDCDFDDIFFRKEVANICDEK